MITLTFCLKRLPSLSRHDFQQYWWHRHAALVRELAPAMRLRRYVQLHTMPHTVNDLRRRGRGAPEEFDGIAVLTFDSVADLIAASDTPEGRIAVRRLVEDERKFIDLTRSPIWVNEEHVIVEGPGVDGSGARLSH
jgi:uncharacterized protein (TIGR02118 family)